eukprot:CAMPEP_0117545514 /NCGR_PEP_ID=MMETSP0784-20121206/46134_1 /TAXON_ID=39447 /ORGANISM="" /LENGTH=373 /DNA_ID=CAMNT_0005342363 /DNA_START=56 /DNA_END=1174 /DNA_ORIENTATION=+
MANRGGMSKDRRRGNARADSALAAYDGELASSILLEDADASPTGDGGADFRQPLYHNYRGLQPRAGGDPPNRTPTRTPSPVYQWNHPKKVNIGEESREPGMQSQGIGRKEFSPPARAEVHSGLGSTSAAPAATVPSALAADKVGSSSSRGLDPQVVAGMPYPHFFNAYWPGAAQAYYGLISNPHAAAAIAASFQAAASSVPGGSAAGDAGSKGGGVPAAAAAAGIDASMLQVMAMMQAQSMVGAAAAAQASQSSGNGAPTPLEGLGAGACSTGAAVGVQDVGVPPEVPQRGGAASGGVAQSHQAEGKWTKSRNKHERAVMEAVGRLPPASDSSVALEAALAGTNVVAAATASSVPQARGERGGGGNAKNEKRN